MTDAATKSSVWNFSELKRLFTLSYSDFNKDQAPRLGAALAYYTALSLAPLLILLIAIAGLVFGKEAAQGQLFSEIQNMMGNDGAKAIEEMVANAAKPASGIVASLIGLGMLVFGASSVASELRASLNTIWNQPQDPNAGIKDLVKERSYALAVVLGCGFLLLVSLAISSLVAGAGKVATGWLPFSESVLHVLNLIISVAVISGVFAFLFKYLPDVKIEWRDVMLGAVVTAILFTIGKFVIGMYLGKAGFSSTYGAAGSLVIVLVWVYYSAQIFFFGAEFTQVYACEHGSDPLCSRRERESKDQAGSKAIPTPGSKNAPEPARQYAGDAAAGNAMVNVQAGPPGKAVGWFGIVLGSLLAGTKVAKTLKK